MNRDIYDEDHESFRKTVRQFLEHEVVPRFAEWESVGWVPKELFERTAAIGINGLQVPEEYGGGGVESFLFNAVVIEEMALAAVNLGGLQVHLGTVLPYFLHLADEEQRRRWFPGFADGSLVSAIAMTEPGTGSDLAGVRTTARRDGDSYVINGSKTFITGGHNADLVVVVARTSESDGDRRRGLSLLVVESGMPGFERGRVLDKIGLKAQDTAELSFTDVRVPLANRLGEEDDAFATLTSNLAQERLTIALGAQAAAAAAVEFTVDYVRQREVFGQRVLDFQNTKFQLADCVSDVAAGRALTDRALVALDAGTLSPTDAAVAKLWCTEMQSRVVDKCLQLHGGYGYIREYPIARLYADARVTRIYGGTSEVMRSIISRSFTR